MSTAAPPNEILSFPDQEAEAAAAMKIIDTAIRNMKTEAGSLSWKLARTIYRVYPVTEDGWREVLYVDMADVPHTAYISVASLEVVIGVGW